MQHTDINNSTHNLFDQEYTPQINNIQDIDSQTSSLSSSFRGTAGYQSIQKLHYLNPDYVSSEEARTESLESLDEEDEGIIEEEKSEDELENDKLNEVMGC